MKRVLSLLLALCLIPAALAVPVGAVDVFPASVYDLLTAVEYTRIDSNGNINVSPRSSFWIEKALYAEFQWVPTVDFPVSRIQLSITAPRKPSEVLIWLGGSFVPLNFSASSNGVYYYTYDSLAAVSPYRVRVSFDNACTGTVALRAMYGYNDNAIDITSVDFFNNVFIGDPELGYRDIVTGDSGTSPLPVAADWYGPYEYGDYGDTEQMLYAECYYKVTAPIGYAQSISYLVYCVGDIRNVGCRLEDSSGNIIGALSSSVEPCGDSQIIVSFHEEMYRLHVYRITADLDGYDLTGRVLSLGFEVEPVHSSAAAEYGWGYYSQLTAAAFLPPETQPNFFSRFVSWLSGRFTDLNLTIENWGQKIVDAISPSDPGSDQFKDDLQQAEDELSHMGDVMDSVTRPNINQINPDVDNIVKPADITLVASPLAVVFDNPYILSMFVLSFTMALAGFVLFGKR